MDSTATKEQILQILDELPEESLTEVSQFLDFWDGSLIRDTG